MALWYGFDGRRKTICGYVLGRRTDESCQQLLEKLSAYRVLRHCTNAFDSSAKWLPETKHWVGKASTQDIGRQNLNFRTHLKRRIAYRAYPCNICTYVSDMKVDVTLVMVIGGVAATGFCSAHNQPTNRARGWKAKAFRI
jgi:IS1 family transposase